MGITRSNLSELAPVKALNDASRSLSGVIISRCHNCNKMLRLISIPTMPSSSGASATLRPCLQQLDVKVYMLH